MNLTSIELHPGNSSENIVLSFRDPGSLNPYNVRAIVGLDAEGIVPRYYGGSGSSKFYNLTLEKRDIIILIRLNPDFNYNETFSDLRDSLYKLISSSRTGLLNVRFKNEDTVIASISGFVTKFETAHFNKEPEVQITVSCDDPMLRAMSPIEIDPINLHPDFTSFQDSLSTAPHGFTFEVTFLNDLASFTMHDLNNFGLEFTVTPSGGFLTNDVLSFSSEYNNKYLYVIRGANTIHLADVIAPGSAWLILFPGTNSFFMDDDDDLSWDFLSYYPTYWGV